MKENLQPLTRQEELKQKSIRCQKVMESSIWQDGTYTQEELQENWRIYSETESELASLRTPPRT